MFAMPCATTCVCFAYVFSSTSVLTRFVKTYSSILLVAATPGYGKRSRTKTNLSTHASYPYASRNRPLSTSILKPILAVCIYSFEYHFKTNQFHFHPLEKDDILINFRGGKTYHIYAEVFTASDWLRVLI